MRVVGCFLEHGDEFLILLRHSHKPEGNTWGLPSGKVEPGESDTRAMVRELYEETGYQASENELEHLGDFPFTNPQNEDRMFVTFRLKLDKPHAVTIEQSAHADHRWVTPGKCYTQNDLIYGLHELLRLIGYVKEEK